MADPAVFHFNFDIFRLQLAGIVPEQASHRALKLAISYANSGVALDEIAMRLKRALEESDGA